MIDYFNGPEVDKYAWLVGMDEADYSFGQKASYRWQSSSNLTPTESLWKYGEQWETEHANSYHMTTTEWENSPWYRPELSFPNGVNVDTARLLAQRKDRERFASYVNSVSDNSILESVGLFGVDLAAQAMDPLNALSGFVPVMPGATRAKWALEGVKGYAKTGALDALVTNFGLEMIVGSQAEHEQADYTMADAAINIAFGIAIGAGMHAGIGWVGDAVGMNKRFQEDAVIEALNEFNNGENINVSKFVNMSKEPDVSGAKTRILDEIRSSRHRKNIKNDLTKTGKFTADEIEYFLSINDHIALSSVEKGWIKRPSEYYGFWLAGVKRSSPEMKFKSKISFVGDEVHEHFKFDDGKEFTIKYNSQKEFALAGEIKNKIVTLAEQNAGLSKELSKVRYNIKQFERTHGKIKNVLSQPDEVKRPATKRKALALKESINEIRNAIATNERNAKSLVDIFKNKEDFVARVKKFEKQPLTAIDDVRFEGSNLSQVQKDMLLTLEAVYKVDLDKIHYETTGHDVKLKDLTKEQAQVVIDRLQDVFGLFQQDVRGSVEGIMENTRKIINIFQKGDVSTLIHETGHILLNMLKVFAPNEYIEAGRFLGVSDEVLNSGRYWAREFHEAFAKSFELYLMSGYAPQKMLNPFKKIRGYLLAIYSAIKSKYFKAADGKVLELSPEIIHIFDGLLDADEAAKSSVYNSKASINATKDYRFIDDVPLPEESKELYQSTVATKEGDFNFELNGEEYSVLQEAASLHSIDKLTDTQYSEIVNAVEGSYKIFNKFNEVFDSIRKYGDITDIKEIKGNAAFRELRDKVVEYIERENMSIPEAINKVKDDYYFAQVQYIRGKINNNRAYNQLIQMAKNHSENNLPIMRGLLEIIEGGDKERFSVDYLSKAYTNKYASMFFGELEKQGLFDAFLKSEALQKDFAEEVHWIETSKKSVTKNEQAYQIAKIYYQTQNGALSKLSSGGYMVNKVANYISKTTHDMERIVKLSDDEFISLALETWDHNRTFGRSATNEDKISFIKYVKKELSTGMFYSVSSDGAISFKNYKGNAVSKLNKQRIIHFKDGYGWFKYNNIAGKGSIPEAILAGFHRIGRATALTERLGPNYEYVVESFLDRMKQIALNDADLAKELTPANYQRISDAIQHVDGTFDIPVDNALAKFGRNLRAVQVTKLGKAVLSALADPVFSASSFREIGGSLLKSYANSIKALLFGRPKGEQREILRMLGYAGNQFAGSALSRFSSIDAGKGLFSKMADWQIKLSGLNWITQTGKENYFLLMAHEIGSYRKLDYNKLPEKLRKTFNQYGIGEREWSIMQISAKKERGNLYFIDPSTTKSIDKATVSKMFDIDDFAASYILSDVESKLRTFYIDQVNRAIITPGAKEARQMSIGTKPGTVAGEAVRTIMQFKSFSWAVMNKVVLPLLKSKDATGIAHMIAMSTVLGYVAMSAKDIVSGREPRDPTKPRTLLASLMQGGAGGIYIDFLFNSQTRYGQGPMATLMGPTYGSLNQLIGVYEAAREGKNPMDRMFYFAKGNMPFINLWYVKGALDYGLLYSFSEMLNPGYSRRLEKRMRDEYNQEYFVSPTYDRLTPFE